MAERYTTGNAHDNNSQLPVQHDYYGATSAVVPQGSALNTLMYATDNSHDSSRIVQTNQQTFEQMKTELREIIAEETQRVNSRQLVVAAQKKVDQEKLGNTKPTPEQQQVFEQAMSLIQSAANGGAMTMTDIATQMQGGIKNLPTTLQRQIMADISKKLNSGELNAKYFITGKTSFSEK